MRARLAVTLAVLGAMGCSPQPQVALHAQGSVTSSVALVEPGPQPEPARAPGLVLRDFIELDLGEPLAPQRVERRSQLAPLEEAIVRCRMATLSGDLRSPSTSFHLVRVQPSGALTVDAAPGQGSDEEPWRCVGRELTRLTLPAQARASVIGLSVTLLPAGMGLSELKSELPKKRAKPPPPATSPEKIVANPKPVKGAATPPKLKSSPTMVGPKYPPELMHRVARGNYGKIRFCYESRLQSDPTLRGRVVVTFTIDKTGTPKDVKAASDDLKDPDLLTCVEKSFAALTFPAPEGGVIKVTYPILLENAGDVPAQPATSATLGGRLLSQVDDATLGLELQRFGEVHPVAGLRAHFVVGPHGAVRALVRQKDGAPAARPGTCAASSGGEAITFVTSSDLDCVAHLAALLD